MKKYVPFLFFLVLLIVYRLMWFEDSVANEQPANNEPVAAAQPVAQATAANVVKEVSESASASAQQAVAEHIEMARTRYGVTQQIIEHAAYTTSYNADWRIPNWVAWELTGTETSGEEVRDSRRFGPDPLVVGATAVDADYKGASPYVRGHMAPAADMKFSPEAMDECFYLSNICPQHTSNNNGVWKRLEEFSRYLAQQSGSLYICCGPIVQPDAPTIGKNKVVVPAQLFKVICRQYKGKWMAVGFVFDNAKCPGDMFNYAISVDSVEALTGHDFFLHLPDSIENQIEAQWDRKDW